MKKVFILFGLLFYISNSFAQFSQYIIQFKNKTGTPYSIDKPTEFLSGKSIQRRAKQHIPIDETDLPVVPRYIDSVRLAGNVSILNQSKWLNQVCIETYDAAALTKISQFNFVLNTQPVKRIAHGGIITRNKFKETLKDIQSPASPNEIQDLNYGQSFGQIHIHEGEFLHNKGFSGQGMLIAIIDAGFYHYKTLPAFDSVRQQQQIIETYDFVQNKIEVNEENTHGMYCFSIIAANIPGAFIGSANKANYLLYRSEDVGPETLVEEQNWIVAAERSDSAGADIITTSLGYTTFDNPVFNHTYADMDGHTTIIAKGASIAASKGMILLMAAGNEGNNSWHYISTPADVDSVLTVGAVDVSGNVAGFSSYGPSADGQVKPTVASVGVATVISSATGQVVSGNGTSFATPNLAGLVTCLWQAFPDFKSHEIMEAVTKSSSIYNNPNDRIGFGIPNFRLAFANLEKQRQLKNAIEILGDKRIKIYPNPASNQFKIIINPTSTSNAYFRLYDISGKLFSEQQVSLVASEPQIIDFKNLQTLNTGVYILKFYDGNKAESFKILIQY